MSAESMQAVVAEEFGGPEVLHLSERPTPEPGEGEVSIDVDYAGVGMVDTLLRSGTFPLPLPLVPGIEVTGRVRATGPGVEGLEAGRPVAALLNDFGRAPRAGGYAQVAVAHHSLVTALPDGADLPRLTAVISNGVAAWIALHVLARIQPRDRVLVLGASGGIGGTAARLAALAPAVQVIGVVGHDPQRGPDECTEIILADDLDDQLESMAGDGTVDVVLDPVGGPLRAAAFEKLAPFGRHIIVGDASADDPPLSGDAAWNGTRIVAGLNVGGVAHLRGDLVADALSAVTELVVRGSLNEPAPAIRPLGDAGAVHEQIADRSAPAKTVLSVDDSVETTRA